MSHTLHIGDCRTVLATLEDASIDAIVCDPPYELGIVGKDWDKTGIAYDVTVWKQCLRVLKPGGHLIAFGGSRTYHRLAVAIEDAGFEIRDQIQWIYGNGFPKNLNVSKAMDKQAGAVREVVGIAGVSGSKRNSMSSNYQGGEYSETAPATDLAKQWHGWGTALKPAHEPAVFARKPICGTVANNVTVWGVGALNIYGTRVAGPHWYRKSDGIGDPGMFSGKNRLSYSDMHTAGRWPANVIFDEEAAQVLDGQSEYSVSSASPRHNGDRISFSRGKDKGSISYGHSDHGGASRFFYTAKASKAEREAGLHYQELVKAGSMTGNDSRAQIPTNRPLYANHHPTVKPLSLMRYLVRLITPPGGTVLDPFMGSGSTGCAAVLEEFNFVGIDITPEYVAIAQKRIAYHSAISPLDGI